MIIHVFKTLEGAYGTDVKWRANAYIGRNQYPMTLNPVRGKRRDLVSALESVYPDAKFITNLPVHLFPKG